MKNTLCENCPEKDPTSLLELITPEEQARVEDFLRKLEDFDFENAGEALPFVILAYSIY